MKLKPCMALISLLILLFLPYAAVAGSTGEGTVKIIDKNGTEQPSQINVTSRTSNSSNVVLDNSSSGNWEESVKGVQTAIEGSFQGVGNWVVSQLMSGSVNLYESNANESSVVQNGGAVEDVSSKTLTYQIGYQMIDPFAPDFCKQVLLVTGGFYICEIFFVILGSFFVARYALEHPESYIEFISSFTGEERRPYTNKNIATTTRVAVAYWAIVLLFVFVVTGTRNLLVATMTGNEITVPMVYANDFFTQLISAAASFVSSFQIKMALYGIYVLISLIFVIGGITDFYLMIGLNKKAYILNKIGAWVYIICNAADLIIVGCVAAGVSIYKLTGDPSYVSVGIVFAALVNLVILASIIVYSIIAGKNIIIRGLSSTFLPKGGM